MTYLSDIEIAHSCKMKPITEIAEKCGFGCQQYLNDTFKKSTGVSPGKYREQFAKKYTE